jgi:hypothetical protein
VIIDLFALVNSYKSPGVVTKLAEVLSYPNILYYSNTIACLYYGYIHVSDYMQHDYLVVHAMLQDVLSKLKQTTYLLHLAWLVISLMAFWASTNHTSIFCDFMHHPIDFGMPAKWNYFATSHRNSTCNGVGAI